MEKLIFYEPYFKEHHNDVNIDLTRDFDFELNLNQHLTIKEFNLVISLLKDFNNSNLNNIKYLIIHNIGCNKRIVFKNIQEKEHIAHIFLTDYYVHDLIKQNKEEMKTYENLFKVIGLGAIFGIFSYIKN
jgi:hypothetical protein